MSQQQQQEPQRPQQYLFVFESSDISRLRADVQSLGFQSLITPGGAVRLVHAVARAFLSAFKVGNGIVFRPRPFRMPG